MAPEPVITDPNSAPRITDNNQAISDVAAAMNTPGPRTGLTDIDEVLDQHTDKTRTALDAAQGTLSKTKNGIDTIAGGESESAQMFKGPKQGPAAPPPQFPRVPLPALPPLGMPPGVSAIAPQALAALLSPVAGLAPTGGGHAAGSRHAMGSGRKEPLSGVAYTRSGTHKSSPAQIAAAIDEAADANHIPQDKAVRAKWHALYRFLIFHESSDVADCIQQVNDVNMSGALAPDGAPGNAARGYCQVIPATFKAYHVAGTSNNIFDPVANIAASMRYVIDHYGVEPGTGPRFDEFTARRHINGYTGY